MDKWLPSEPVKHLEASYDDLTWDYVDPHDAANCETGWRITSVEGRRGRTIRREYGAPMFWTKDAAEAGPSEDVDPREHVWWCNRCAEGRGHECLNCATPVNHDAPLCLACWSRPMDGDRLPLLRTVPVVSQEAVRLAAAVATSADDVQRLREAFDITE